MSNPKLIFLFIGAALAVVAVFVAGLLTGPVEIPAWDVFAILFGADDDRAFIIHDLRLPRTGIALVMGGMLALGGFAMQAIVRNPLADPYLMGLSSGAGFGANLYLVGMVTLGAASVYALPLFAFTGSLLSLGLLIGLGFRNLHADAVRLLLAGVAISSLFTALTGLLIFTASEDNQLRNLLVWTVGSFNGVHQPELRIAALLLLIYFIFSMSMAARMDVLALGEMQAHGLGLNVRNTRILLLVVSAYCLGGAIAFTGPVGFVGMMVPHVCRALVGHRHLLSLPLGMLVGAAFLGFCDVLSQWLYPPAGLPVGILTALFGVPFFLYLLFRRPRGGEAQA